ncbi:MAG: alpha/beta hydrolase [Betaproteobacteria bacterium]|nr:alpha/beta hydrolase [Betaproteobacteria bacterium]MDE2122083.1 alpha/beta hydrolase [Betaproteobacteria bacterium]MDE2186456.1 alpha/beta hydrolase [Betaproteobacteria bacterium]MDE2324420.1 alpha/beta hydrolase [Betaproteobacteria bacterium]
MQCVIDEREAHVEYVEPTVIANDTVPTAIVLLHGAANDHRSWLPVAPGLAQAGYAVYAPDLPAHGGSGGSLCTAVASMATWVLKLLDACGLERCALAGHSMGSLVALHAAGLAPQRISHLALVGTAWPMRVAPALLELAQSQTDVALRNMAIWSHMQREGQPLQPALVQQTLELMQSVQQAGCAQGNVLATDLAACNAYANALDMAARVRVPAAFILGEHDRMTPTKATQRLREALPQARLTTLDAGHALMSEAPGAVVHALAALLALPAERL